MSKTLGNVVDPNEVIAKFGADALRYYVARHMRSDSDSLISVDLIRQAYNSELGNKIGNLFSRAAKFSKSRFNGSIPQRAQLGAADEGVREMALETANGFARAFEMHEIPRLTQSVVATCEALNNYFAEQAPWGLIKNPDTVERCGTVIYVTLDILRLLFEGFRQIIPESANKALVMLGSNTIPGEGRPWAPQRDLLTAGHKLTTIDTLFPRVQE